MKGKGHRQEAIGEKYLYAQQERTSLANDRAKQ